LQPAGRIEEAALEPVLSIIMAGGAGERLLPLTRERAKPAVPFAGKFRIVDFTLSNCINSGLRQVFVLTQYRSESLHRHIQEGWGISSSGLGDFIYSVPPQQKVGADWYRGTADAVRQNLNLVKNRNVSAVLILSGDHVYKMDYLRLVAYHREKKANLTISAVRAKTTEAAGKLGVLDIDTDYRLAGFQEKPSVPAELPGVPGYCLASMGVYLFDVNTLIKALEGSEDDFGKHIIPNMIGGEDRVYVYDYEQENRITDYVVEVRDGRRRRMLVDRTRDSGYWRDVGTIDAYYETSMELLSVDPVFNLYGDRWPLRTYQRPLPPSRCVLGGRTPESLVSDGCIISGGTVWNSILSPAVIVERDSFVEQSIVFDDVVIEPNARVRRAIIDKGARVQAHASVGFDRDADRARGCYISDGGVTVVPKGADIGRIEPSLF
jgi:glucose-1-phosphate adenylyltransferase